MEVAALSGSPRPTSARFLNADHSNPWAQTSSGSCTKRLREVVLPFNIAEGRGREASVPSRHARRKAGAAPLQGRGWEPRGHKPLGIRPSTERRGQNAMHMDGTGLLRPEGP